MSDIDIVIPVYHEGENILEVLDCFKKWVRTPLRVLICYDRDDDNTLAALRRGPSWPFKVQPVKNRGSGVHGAVMSGFTASAAPAVLVFPADDTYNAPIVDSMVAKFREGCDVVAASRFMPGGGMVGCPWLKAVLVRSSAFALYHAARIPTRDPSNGLRLFSRRVLERVPVESGLGFAFSIELLVKCHRLGWRVAEVPAQWMERRTGASRFRILRWLPTYLRWFSYAFATTYGGRGAESVVLRKPHGSAHG